MKESVIFVELRIVTFFAHIVVIINGLFKNICVNAKFFGKLFRFELGGLVGDERLDFGARLMKNFSDPRAFVGVEGVGEEVARNAGVRQDALKLGRCRLDEVDPTGRRKVRSLPETSDRKSVV